ncbi:hypothetical protein H8D30_01680, partial [bacterium]|nr:hypothetical protein [bacterium]
PAPSPDTNPYQCADDALGRRTKWTDRLGRVTAYGYDLAGRETLSVTPDGKEHLTAHDAAGNVVERIFRGDPSDASLDVTETYTYDQNNRLATRTDPDGCKTTLGHNALGLLKTVTDASGDTRTDIHSPGGQLVAQLAPGGARIDYEYTLDGRIAANTYALAYAYVADSDRVAPCVLSR